MFNKVLIVLTIFGVLCLLLTPVSTLSAAQQMYKPATKAQRMYKPATKKYQRQRLPSIKPFTKSRLRKFVPDLKPLACTVSPSQPGTNQRITFTIPVKNLGTGQAAFSTSPFGRISLSGVGSYSPFSIPQFVNAGQTRDFKVSVEAYKLTPGSHTLKAKIDSRNQIAEINENNNEINCRVTVRDTGAPDLVIKAVWKTVGNPNNVDGYSWRFSVKNQGQQPTAMLVYPKRIISGGCSKYVFAPRTGVTFGPGQERTFEAQAMGRGIRVGTQSCTFTVDPDRVVPESNENNNSVQTSVVVIKKN